MLYRISRFICIVILKLFIRIRIKGKENFLEREPFILASNHTSNLDPVLLGIACPRKVTFLAKEELFLLPVVSRWFWAVGCVPVRRKNADFSALRQGLVLLRKGKPLVVFPQGARGSRQVKPGVGFLVRKSQVSVLPVKICNSGVILPPGKLFPRSGRIDIIVGKLLQFSQNQEPEYIADQIFKAINSLH